MRRRALPALLATSLTFATSAAPARATDLPGAPAAQVAEYDADVPKSVVELQPYRRTQVLAVRGPDGREGTATLVDLSPANGVWYLLTLDFHDGAPRTLHLENPSPGSQTLALDPSAAGGLVLGGAERTECPLASVTMLEDAPAQPGPYASVCDGRLFVHQPVKGRRSDLEAAVAFLRDHVWGGEAIVTLAKETVLADAEREEATTGPATPAPAPAEAAREPAPARLDPAYAGRGIGRGSLGIPVVAPAGRDLPLGRWVAARDVPGVFVSLIAPEAIAADILAGRRDRAHALDGVEASALVYLVAFDLGRFTLGYGVGTGNPRVDWGSEAGEPAARRALPGPDGIGTIRPLVASGMIPPQVARRTVAAFAGGFKRYHGAFRSGELAQRNHGSHYGFVQEGVVLSKLQPGLATLFVRRDATVEMRTWTEADAALLSELRYARQNGVPLVEWDESAGAPVPGELVTRWGAGGWSGSAEKKLRTARGGACLQQNGDAAYLVYAYFSDATPSAMARVFQAYGCRYAMQLDINAPILTYLALYPGDAVEPAVQYLMTAMGEADATLHGRPVPRFLALPDDRDFFYVMRRAGDAR